METYAENFKFNVIIKKQMFQCPSCGEEFSDIKALRNHKESECAYVPPSPKKTSRAKAKTKSASERVTRKLVKDFPNDITKTKTDRNEKSTGKYLWSCTNCPQVFTCQSGLKDHEKIHNGGTACIVRKRRTIKKPKIQVESDNNPELVCNLCRIKFITITDLREHQESHVKPFKCIVCQKQFFKFDGLFHHQIYCHKVDIKRDPEEKIAQEKIKKSQIHIKREPKKYLCETCGKEFVNNYRLKRHIGMHLGIKRLSCSYCGRGFAEKDTLAKHERIHTGERPYSCEYCGKCFRQDGPFKVHLRTHTGERPYKCHLCGKGFITNQLLKFHRRNCGEETYRSGLLKKRKDVRVAVCVPREGCFIKDTVYIKENVFIKEDVFIKDDFAE